MGSCFANQKKRKKSPLANNDSNFLVTSPLRVLDSSFCESYRFLYIQSVSNNMIKMKGKKYSALTDLFRRVRCPRERRRVWNIVEFKKRM